jgi:hypothetical protein
LTAEKSGKKFAELSQEAQALLADYRSCWDKKFSEAAGVLTDVQYTEIMHSLYKLLGLPAPLVVPVQSPLQLMLMPALLRIRALSDDHTWSVVKDNLRLPRWKQVIDQLENKFSNDDLETLLKGRNESGDYLSKIKEMEGLSRGFCLNSVFGRPKGQSVNPRLGFFETVMAKLDSEMNDAITPELCTWLNRECRWTDGGLPGVWENWVNIDARAEATRMGQLRTAIQNLSNMGTTERAALRIFRERGEQTSFVPEQIVRQGELETEFIEQLGESTVNILAQALSAKNLEPTIFESYPPALEALLDGSSSGLWFTGQLAVGFTSSIFLPQLDRLPVFTFLLDVDEMTVFSDSTNRAIEHLRHFLANRTPICPFGEIIFVSKPPLSYELDEERRFHSLEAPALRYDDGFSLFSIHGVTVHERTVMAPETLTVSEIESEINLEMRRVMMDQFGIGRYLDESHAEILHEDQYGTLFRRRMAGDEPLVMVRVRNSTPEPDGSFKHYFLRVPPFMRTAKEAVAWTFNFEADQYQPEEET